MNKRAKKITKPITIAAAVLTLFAACDVYIFPSWFDDGTDLSFELTWSGDKDLDLYVSIPAPADGDTTNNNGVPVYTSVDQAYGFTSESAGDQGFFITTFDATYRENIYQGNRSDSENRIVFDASASGDNSEIVSISEVPFDYTISSGYQTTGTTNNGLDNRFDYAWVGVLGIYVWTPSGNVSDADNVKITAYDSSGNVVGEYGIPESTTVRGASLIRVPVFRVNNAGSVSSSYQLLADTRLLTSSSQIRGLEEPTVIGDYQVINVFGSENE